MPGRILLDTNVVIAFFAGETAVLQHLSKAEVLVSSTVLGEFYYGVRKSAHMAANLSRIEQFAASVRVLGCDEVTAQHYGQIKDGLRIKGRPIPENDIWIAAIAQQYGLTLATRDEHFKDVNDLALENW